MGSLPIAGGPLKNPAWHSLEPLGDQGVIVRFATEERALAWAAAAREILPHEVVAAYRSVAVFAPLADWEIGNLTERLAAIVPANRGMVGRLIEIPCCYELGADLGECAESLKMTTQELARLHGSVDYQVFAIGFIPGFPYMGWLPEPIAGLDRLPSPRTRVPAGSVGITGRQTGIYPAEVPGGWHLIGKTPCPLADLTEGESGWFALAPGDRVRFRPIPEIEFNRLAGCRPTVLEPLS